MNDHDQKLQALLDDRLGERRDAGLRSATLDPAARRALGAYKVVYRALREEPASVLPVDFAARLTDRIYGVEDRALAPWQVAVLASAGGLALCAVSVLALGADPARLLAAFGGPLGPVSLAIAIAPFFDRLLDRWDAARSNTRSD